MTALREEGSTLQDTLSTNAQNSDPTLEGLQKIDISGSMTDARAVIENSEAADREETRSLIESVNSTEKNVDSLVEDISEAVAKSSRKAQESTRQSIKGIIESLISDIPDVPRIEVTDAGDDGQVTIALNDGEEGQDDGEEAQTESGPAIRLSLVDADPEEVQKADNNMKLLTTISGSMAGAYYGTLIAVEAAVNGLNDNVEETRKAVSGNYSGSTAALTEYGTKFDTFSPVLDSAAVSENVSKMNTNYSALQQEVLENNQSYQNYANKVYQLR